MSQNLHFWCWIYIFFLPWTYPVNSVFSVIVGIYNIHVLISIFSSLQVLLRWVRKSLFPVSMTIVVKEKLSFNTIIQLISSNYPPKNGVKQTKTTQRCKGVSSTPMLRTLNLVMRSICSKNYLFGYLLLFIIYLGEFDLFDMPYFS